eukprot:5108652-Amphidinium_carterae.1
MPQHSRLAPPSPTSALRWTHPCLHPRQNPEDVVDLTLHALLPTWPTTSAGSSVLAKPVKAGAYS